MSSSLWTVDSWVSLLIEKIATSWSSSVWTGRMTFVLNFVAESRLLKVCVVAWGVVEVVGVFLVVEVGLDLSLCGWVARATWIEGVVGLLRTGKNIGGNILLGIGFGWGHKRKEDQFMSGRILAPSFGVNGWFVGSTDAIGVGPGWQLWLGVKDFGWWVRGERTLNLFDFCETLFVLDWMGFLFFLVTTSLSPCISLFPSSLQIISSLSVTCAFNSWLNCWFWIKCECAASTIRWFCWLPVSSGWSVAALGAWVAVVMLQILPKWP